MAAYNAEEEKEKGNEASKTEEMEKKRAKWAVFFACENITKGKNMSTVVFVCM